MRKHRTSSVVVVGALGLASAYVITSVLTVTALALPFVLTDRQEIR